MKKQATGSRELKAKDMTAHLGTCESGWVALSPDERHVVGTGPTLRKAQEQAGRNGCDHPVFVKVLPRDKGYVPRAS